VATSGGASATLTHVSNAHDVIVGGDESARTTSRAWQLVKLAVMVALVASATISVLKVLSPAGPTPVASPSPVPSAFTGYLALGHSTLVQAIDGEPYASVTWELTSSEGLTVTAVSLRSQGLTATIQSLEWSRTARTGRVSMRVTPACPIVPTRVSGARLVAVTENAQGRSRQLDVAVGQDDAFISAVSGICARNHAQGK
jgi:hypothetical protein